MLRAPLGLSGGKLVALDGTPAVLRLELDELRPLELLVFPVVLRLVLLTDRPLESLSNTVAPLGVEGSLAEEDLDNRSINECFLVSGFLRSFRE